MFNFFKKQKVTIKEDYDHEKLTPAIRSSICTGEKTAGFREKQSGQFHDVMLVRTEEDLKEFRERYGINGEVETFY